MKITTLRYKLLAWFLLFSFILILLFLPLHMYMRSKEKNSYELYQGINQLQLSLANDLKTTSGFFHHEASNALFYITGESRFQQRHNRFTRQSDSLVTHLLQSGQARELQAEQHVRNLRQQLKIYHQTFDSIIKLTYYKGFNNFGLEGEMYEHMVMLDEVYNVSQTDILKLRANEKNYLLYRRSSYADKLNEMGRHLLNKYKRNTPNSNKIIEVLHNYLVTFNQVVAYDRLIGINDENGLKYQLLLHSSKIEEEIAQIKQAAEMRYQQSVNRANISYLVFFVLILLLSVVLSFKFSRKLSQPLLSLTSYIQELAKSNFHYPANNSLKNSAREIALIYQEFRNLVTQLYIRENQRDKARRRSAENEQKFRELADLLPQSIFETDYLGNYTYVNKQWFKVFGYAESDLNDGLNLIETLVSEQGERIMDNQQLENSDFVAITRHNTTFPASVYTSNIYKNGKLAGKRGIIVDVTVRNKYIETLKRDKQKAQLSDKLKSSFLANMSHEIRTPMNTILGFSDLLESAEISETDKKDFLNHIKSSGELLLNLIDDIIDIAKIEAGEIKIIKKESHLPTLFKELEAQLNDYKRQMSKNNVKLCFTAPDNDISIKTDPFRLKQILTNLGNNAIKFTDNGKVEIGYRHKSQNQLEFFVNDTGVGLTKENLDYIFQRFKQVEKDQQKEMKGHGLGLAISKNLVQLLGGDLWVKSAPGKGTRFTFTHPLVRIEKITKQEVKQTSDESNYQWSRYTILVVEDEDENYRFLKEALKATGARIFRAYNGEEAVNLVKSTSVDLVLMDVQMPKMDGYTATRYIKKIQPTLPVVAQTARAMANEREQSVLAGCDDYITKPIRINLLLPKLAQFLLPVDKSQAKTIVADKQNNKSVNS